MTTGDAISGGELEIERVVKTYRDQRAVDDVTLRVRPGEILAILGPSGSGKTTLLNMVGGRLRPDSGDIRIGGASVINLPPDKIDTAMVFQDYALFPHLNVRDNVGFGLRLRGMNRPFVREEADRLLALVGLHDLGDRAIGQLSGGQRQRVATARALAVRPKVLLLDEPLGALDRQIRGRLQKELSALLRRLHMTTIIVTHDQEEAFAMADTIAIMRAGRLEQVGHPMQLYDEPATPFVATFLGDGTLLHPTRIDDRGAEIAGVHLPVKTMAVLPENTARILVRPQVVTVGKAGELTDPTWQDVSVEVAKAFGAETVLMLRLSDGQVLKARQYGASSLAEGDRVECRVDPDSLRVLATSE